MHLRTELAASGSILASGDIEYGAEVVLGVSLCSLCPRGLMVRQDRRTSFDFSARCPRRSARRVPPSTACVRAARVGLFASSLSS